MLSLYAIQFVVATPEEGTAEKNKIKNNISMMDDLETYLTESFMSLAKNMATVLFANTSFLLKLLVDLYTFYAL